MLGPLPWGRPITSCGKLVNIFVIIFLIFVFFVVINIYCYIQLENILFRSGYSYLTKESKSKLDEIAKILVERTDIYFNIEGHVCCTHGSRDAIDRKTKKRNLSLARAKTVYDYLADKGVKRYRMKFVGQRRKFPLGGEPEFDRRVEIVVTRVIKKTN